MKDTTKIVPTITTAGDFAQQVKDFPGSCTFISATILMLFIILLDYPAVELISAFRMPMENALLTSASLLSPLTILENTFDSDLHVLPRSQAPVILNR